MLFLFFITAYIFVFLKAFLKNLDSKSFAVSSVNIVSIFGFSSRAEPGKIQHIFTSFFLSVRVESTVKLAGMFRHLL